MKTFAIIAMAGAAGFANAQLINEFEPNPIGGDPAMVNFEIKGQAGASFSGVVYSIEGDFAAPNFVDRVSAVSGTFDANGILNVMIADLENPSFTLVLGSGGTATTSDSVDGSSDFNALFGTVFDAVTSNDSVADEAFSIVPLLGVGTNLAFVGSEPVRTFRDGVTNAWYSVDFNGDVFDAAGNSIDPGLFDSDPTAYNFGGVNQTLIPAPASAALLGLGGLVAARRRRA